MSAFLVTPEHIQAIVAYSLHEARDYTPPMPGDRMAAILAKENINSVRYRYQERLTDRTEQEDADYIQACARPWLEGTSGKVPVRETIEVLKLMDSLDYQSCEHPDWETSDAYRLLNRIRMQAIPRLPGYAISPWTI